MFAAPIPDDELTLRTRRLALRPVRVEDAPRLFEYCSDPEVPRRMTWAAHRDLGETEAFLARVVAGWAQGQELVWAISEAERLCGLVGVGIVRGFAAVRMDQGELGYWLGRPFHGRGLMTEAAAAATDAAFSRLALHKLTVRAFASNTASLAVIRKLGFREVGVARRDVCKDGVWHDHVLFEMLADDPAAGRLAPFFAPDR